MSSILLIDDEPLVRSTIRLLLCHAGHEIHEAGCVEEAATLLKQNRYDVIISDIFMPDSGDKDTLRRIKALHPDCPIILITGQPGLDTAADAVRQGAFDYLTKNHGFSELRVSVEKALQVKKLQDTAARLHRRNQRYQRQLKDLVRKRTRALEDKNTELRDALDNLGRAQAVIVRQERLNALAQMVSGIAHDFNNVLMPILGLTEFLIHAHPQCEHETEIRRTLGIIHSAAEDAREIVRRLREFYRPNERPQVECLDVNALLGQVADRTRPRWQTQPHAEGLNIALQIECPPHIEIRVNRAQIHEALGNLVFNAVDAMPGGGSITLGAREDEEHIDIWVRDTGAGMTADVLERCIEPMFSTKGERGNGLGLSMAHGIAQQHGGTLIVESERGKGTCVTMRFQRAALAALPATAPSSPPNHHADRHLHVLIVDDDDRTRALLLAYLARLGHIASEARSADDAMARCSTDPGIELVITDQAMPDMNGAQLAKQLRKINPHLPVIMLTGFGDIMKCQGHEPAHIDLLLSKPVSQDELQKAILQVLAKRHNLHLHRESPPAPVTADTCRR